MDGGEGQNRRCLISFRVTTSDQNSGCKRMTHSRSDYESIFPSLVFAFGFFINSSYISACSILSCRDANTLAIINVFGELAAAHWSITFNYSLIYLPTIIMCAHIKRRAASSITPNEFHLRLLLSPAAIDRLAVRRPSGVRANREEQLPHSFNLIDSCGTEFVPCESYIIVIGFPATIRIASASADLDAFMKQQKIKYGSAINSDVNDSDAFGANHKFGCAENPAGGEPSPPRHRTRSPSARQRQTNLPHKHQHNFDILIRCQLR